MKRGDIVLVSVPYIGASGAKIRPAVIIQNDLLDQAIQETIIAVVTSNLANSHQPNQFVVDISTPDGKTTGLLTDSAVRGERLHTIPRSDIRKVIGSLSSALISKLDDCLKSALGIT